ncbi:MAG: GDP-mannose 4,6-dehydratase, partial [Caldilineaceae bacterium]|nr:GDP-mannose 4,6-dehydratase [Caldilineaceae bacterium]
MQNLLITGGAGFIGCNYVRLALETHPDYNVVVFDKLTYAGRMENLQDVADRFGDRFAFVQGDICDAAAVEAAVRDHAIDTIVNFAAET